MILLSTQTARRSKSNINFKARLVSEKLSEIRPIFLFSLPRAGSTLVQRVLAAHDDIATTSEPWLLLPFLFSIREQGVYAEYSHKLMVQAVEDFCGELPGGIDDYFEELRTFVLQLYAKAAKGEAGYFLDKTPRYHLVVEEIIRLFPDGKFIFLWRDPLAVIASIIETWGQGKWNLYLCKVDLFDGLTNLISAYSAHAGQVCAVKYENLLSNPEAEWKRVFAYLELPFDVELLSRFKEVHLSGRMGDPTGVQQYQALSKEPLEKWKRVLINPIRKAWCRRYLRWLGEDRLATMGYDLAALLSALDSVSPSMKFVGADILRMARGLVYCLLETHIIKYKLKALPNWYKVHRYH